MGVDEWIYRLLHSSNWKGYLMRVVILEVDDWTALYINGEKVEENHSLNVTFVLEHIAERFGDIPGTFKFESYFAEPDQDVIDEGGVYYPDQLKDVEPELRGPIEP